MDKLAEEILFGYRLKAGGMTEADMIEAMQAYHEAANKQITDEDIEAWANNRWVDSLMISATDVITGAMSFRDGEIKHIEK